MDEALRRAFTDAYLRYEIAFAQFTASNTARAAEAEQQERYREFADAQEAFLLVAQQFAGSLLVQAEELIAPPPAPEIELDDLLDSADPPDAPQEHAEPNAPDQELISPESLPEPEEPHEQEFSPGKVRAGFFRFGRSRSAG